jgi:flagellar basal body-associated protein FliL
MALNKTKPKKTQKKNTESKQGHKLVWFTLIIIAIPVVIVAYVLLTSMGGQGEPVVGNRFNGEDLNPSITEEAMNSIQEQASGIGGVEEVTINLKSATLRVHLNMDDSYTQDQIQAASDQVYEIVAATLPIDQYFTNREDAKMYDLEIDVYNYIVDDSHPAEGQIYIKTTKTGAATDRVTDVMTTAKDPELVAQIKR